MANVSVRHREGQCVSKTVQVPGVDGMVKFYPHCVNLSKSRRDKDVSNMVPVQRQA